MNKNELDYDRGMPEKGKPAFPIGVDMAEKLRQLESRRIYFFKMAGSDERRRTYIYCQEAKLVRIVVDQLRVHQDYADCITNKGVGNGQDEKGY